ncbi:MAG TPA: ATP-binding protein, partial [Burkholderiaceae bacterium]|nr:ATP-binding protein [Burkholderiaceae bacterium]
VCLRAFSQQTDAAFFQAGSLGAAMIGVSLVLNGLARRVGQQERMVLAKNVELQAQIEMNRLVIRDMPQGVLVMSPRGEVKAANPAARLMLGASRSTAEDQFDRWMREFQPSLVTLLADWAKNPGREPRVQELIVDAAPATRQIVSMNATLPLAARPRMIRVRSIPALTNEREAPFVVYLEDLREVEAQAVQLKLASMGRLSASIAHEIRNPLAAIGHASALLSEEHREPAGVRLIRIIDDNVRRLDRIVNDILAVSRSARANPEQIDLTVGLPAVVDDFARAHGVRRERITIDVPEAAAVMFDRTHFTQILDNLLSNAVRHASEQDGAIEIVMDAAPTGELSISVIDDGPGVPESLRSQLFEPFFTTFRKGTGLGLYLARELAIANHATLFLDDAGRLSGACFTLRIATTSHKAGVKTL